MLKRKKGSLNPFDFSKLWIKPVGKCKGKVYAETVHDELGSWRPSHVWMSDMLWCLAKEDISLKWTYVTWEIYLWEEQMNVKNEVILMLSGKVEQPWTWK